MQHSRRSGVSTQYNRIREALAAQSTHRGRPAPASDPAVRDVLRAPPGTIIRTIPSKSAKTARELSRRTVTQQPHPTQSEGAGGLSLSPVPRPRRLPAIAPCRAQMVPRFEWKILRSCGNSSKQVHHRSSPAVCSRCPKSIAVDGKIDVVLFRVEKMCYVTLFRVVRRICMNLHHREGLRPPSTGDGLLQFSFAPS